MSQLDLGHNAGANAEYAGSGASQQEPRQVFSWCISIDRVAKKPWRLGLATRTMKTASTPEQPVMAFASAAAFRKWLAQHHADHPGIWLKIAKKASGIPTVTYAEALDEALCFGWIDGQKKAFDASAFLQKFTKRGKRSVWSKINVGHIARLENEGRMQPAGLAAVAAAKADGRWEAAYHSFSAAEMPEDFLAALKREPDAKAFYDTLNKTQRYSFLWRIATAKKAETRSKRIVDFVTMLKRGEKFH